MATVADVMTSEVRVCRETDTLHRAASILWEHDCGLVPVVDEQNRPVGVITDRDVCMAALSRGERLHEMNVAPTLGGVVYTLRANDSVDRAHDLMRQHQVRRLPVVDAEGRLVGIVSLCDLARAGLGAGAEVVRRKAVEETGATLAAIVRPHGTPYEAPSRPSPARRAGAQEGRATRGSAPAKARPPAYPRSSTPRKGKESAGG